MKLENIKSLFKQWRILFLLFCLILSYFMIQPSFFTDGAAIRSIEKNSPAALAGIHSPSGKDKPMFREIITTVNGKSISTVDDFAAATANFQEGDLVQISTLARYTYDGSDRKLHIFRQELSYNLYYNATTGLGIEVYDAPTSNLRKGLDLQGGTRVLLQPEAAVSAEDMSLIIQSLTQRLNVYGLSDLVITPATDLTGSQYILVEIAGVTKEEIQQLIASQGKFEAKIGNTTVFSGGKDITYVCRSGDCSFVVDPRRPCSGALSSGYICSFSFSISLSQEAAERHSNYCN